MNNVLAWFGAIVVAILAALFAVPAMIDWNGYRGVFEEEATRVLGREVRLGGNVNVRLLPAPYVSFEKMRISDPGSQTGEPLFRAESFTMWLAISPLVRGVVQANHVELKKPVVKLAMTPDGSGNWSSLQLTPGTLPFVPADVMLNSVKITGGEVGLAGPNGGELTRLEAIDGELVADGIKGPFKFRGRLKSSGELREVRFASASPDPNGDIRFKVSVAGTGTNSSYVLDGRAIDLGGKPSLSGDLSAKIAPDLSAAARPPDAPPAPAPAAPVAEPAAVTVGAAPGSEPAATVPIPAAAKAGAPLYDLRGTVSGDASGFRLSQITVTSEGTGPPQLVTGEARLAWADRTKVDLTLASRWIDLDAMFGTGRDVVPLEAARGLFDVLMRALPATADTNVNLTVDQLNLGADQISNVRIAAVRSGGPLELGEFKVSLPGSTQLALAGKLTPGETSPKFDGTIGLKGQSLMRFLAWGLKRPAIGEGRSDGPFALSGNLNFSSRMIELSEAKVGFSDVPMTAGVRLDLGERRRLGVTLEGQKIDLGRIWPGGTDIGALQQLLPRTAPQEGAAPAKDNAGAAWFDAANSDLSLGLKAGTLIDGTRTLRNVEADVSIERGKIAMRSLKFSGEQGLEVELEGEAADIDTKAKGTVRGLIVAPNATSAQNFADLTGISTQAPELVAYFDKLGPMRLAGTLQLGMRVPGAADLTLDGTLRGGRLTASLELDGGLGGWRAAPVNLTGRLETPDVAQALDALSLGLPLRQATGEPASGRLMARASGTPAKGLLAFAALESSNGLNVDYNGTVKLVDAAPAAIAGDLKIAARDVRPLLALVGVKLPGGAAAVTAQGELGLTKSAGDIALNAKGLMLGGTPVSGLVTVSRHDGASATSVSGDLQADEASLPGLLVAVLDRAAPPPAQAAPGSDAPPTPNSDSEDGPVPPPALWPEQSFDFSGLDGLDGKMTVRFGRLLLEPGLAISNARLDLALKPERLEVKALQGDALGGKLNGRIAFDKAAAGVSVDGKIAIDVPSAGQPKPDAAAPPDVANLALEFTGRALSPAALMSDLKGKGELKLGDVRLSGMDPAAVSAVASAALLGQGPQSGEPLASALRDKLKHGQLPLGTIAIPITIADGAMKLAKVELDREDGRTTFDTAIELATLKLDSEWSIEARLPKSTGKVANKLLPPVTVVYTGKLKDIAAIEPGISATALERELTVRKMERDVEELERLRKLDEQRAQEERDRIKAEQERVKKEREKAAAAAAAAAGAPAPQAPAVPPSGKSPPPPPDGAALPPGQEGVAPQPQSGADPATGANPQQATNAEQETAPADPAAASQARPPPPRRRRPPNDNWNPFTGQF